MTGRSGWLGASDCIYTTWGVRSLTSPCPNSTTRPSLRITLKSERSHDQPVMRRCVYSSCSYGPLLRTASGRPRIPTTCCRVMPGSSLDICSPVVQAERRETTERARNSVFTGGWSIRSRWELRRDASKNSRFFEIARVLVRLDHVASFIVNPDHDIM
jgi:hypothetical protein